jgi:hypothetical protein
MPKIVIYGEDFEVKHHECIMVDVIDNTSER